MDKFSGIEITCVEDGLDFFDGSPYTLVTTYHQGEVVGMEPYPGTAMAVTAEPGAISVSRRRA